MASMRNQTAGDLLRSLRIDRGYSPEQLAWEIYKAGHGSVSGRQLRRIEAGVVPTPRIMFAVAQFYERPPSVIWAASRCKRAEPVAA